MRFYDGATELDADDIAEMLAADHSEWTADRLAGMYGPGTIFTVHVSADEYPSWSPWDDDFEHAAVLTLGNEYIWKNNAEYLPAVLQDAVAELVSRNQYSSGRAIDYDSYELRVLEKLSRAHGWNVELVQLQNYHDYAYILVFGRGWAQCGYSATADEVIKSVADNWRQWFAGEVMQYAIEDSDGNTVDSLCGMYGDDSYLSETIADAILGEVQAFSEKIRSGQL